MPRLPKTWTTLVVSTLAHGAFAGVVAGHGFPAAASRSGPIVPVELVLNEIPKPSEIQTAVEPVEALRGATTARAAPPHHHAYPVPLDHDATPHDPSLVHASIAVAPANPAPDAEPAIADQEPPRPIFVLGPNAALVSHGGAARDGHGISSGSATGPEILNERDVSVRARLVARGPLVYPADARRAEIEADVPVEIVVDETGSVTSASALDHPRYGLDRAAVEAVRGYRFSTARRDGRAVRVRMRWVVQFRLD